MADEAELLVRPRHDDGSCALFKYGDSFPLGHRHLPHCKIY